MPGGQLSYLQARISQGASVGKLEATMCWLSCLYVHMCLHNGCMYKRVCACMCAHPTVCTSSVVGVAFETAIPWQ